MIPLGSCTMKLNATAEMMPVTWPEFGRLHPFAPRRRRPRATSAIFTQLETMLAEITGFAAVVAAAERRLAGRVRRPARHPRLPREPRRGPPRRLPDPVVGARHQPGVAR